MRRFSLSVQDSSTPLHTPGHMGPSFPLEPQCKVRKGHKIIKKVKRQDFHSLVTDDTEIEGSSTNVLKLKTHPYDNFFSKYTGLMFNNKLNVKILPSALY